MRADCPEFRDLVTFVPNKKTPVYNWFYYKEGFSRDLVVHFLNKYKPTSVLDPFCGSGTSLLASKEMGIPSAGIDSSPIAVLASRAKTWNYDVDELEEVARDILSEPYRKVEVPKHLKRFFPRPVLEDIWIFREKILSLSGKPRDFFLLALITSAYKCSWIYKDGAVLKVRKRPVPPFRKFFKRIVKRMMREAGLINGPEPEVIRGDARTFRLQREFDLVITSPPYINKIEYARIYRVENEIIGEEPDPPLRSFLSPEPESYFQDMGLVLDRIAEHLNGYLVMVVAGAVLPDGRVIDSPGILADMLEERGFSIIRICNARKRVATTRRTIKIGEAWESIIEAKKEGA